MKTKNIGFIIGSALTLGLITGCGLGDVTNGAEVQAEVMKKNEVTQNLHSSIETSEEKGTTTVYYKVKNVSGKEQKLTFPNGLQADFLLYNENGKKLKQLSNETMAIQAIQEVTLASDEELSYEFSFTNLKAGKYVVEAFLTAIEEKARVAMDVMIEKEFYQTEEGTLVGQIDNHSVEILIDGKPISFQLTDEAKQQIEQLNDGQQIAFEYTDTGIEQKTIERFLPLEAKTNNNETITLTKSVLEVEQKKSDLALKLLETKDNNLLKELSPFEVFQLYMYIKAGEDYQTLYHFHLADEETLSVEEFIAENTTDEAIEQNRSFMRMLNEVRHFEVVYTDTNRAYISFKLPSNDENVEFKLTKGKNNIWYVNWVPFQ